MFTKIMTLADKLGTAVANNQPLAREALKALQQIGYMPMDIDMDTINLENILSGNPSSISNLREYPTNGFAILHLIEISPSEFSFTIDDSSFPMNKANVTTFRFVRVANRFELIDEKSAAFKTWDRWGRQIGSLPS